jgi:hypothetical protein
MDIDSWIQDHYDFIVEESLKITEIEKDAALKVIKQITLQALASEDYDDSYPWDCYRAIDHLLELIGVPDVELCDM